jgi:hypothetical protein
MVFSVTLVNICISSLHKVSSLYLRIVHYATLYNLVTETSLNMSITRKNVTAIIEECEYWWTLYRIHIIHSETLCSKLKRSTSPDFEMTGLTLQFGVNKGSCGFSWRVWSCIVMRYEACGRYSEPNYAYSSVDATSLTQVTQLTIRHVAVLSNCLPGRSKIRYRETVYTFSIFKSNACWDCSRYLFIHLFVIYFMTLFQYLRLYSVEW